MIFDTDILIWILRGHKKAAQVLEREDDRALSSYSFMELLQGAQSKRDLSVIKKFITNFGFNVFPIDEKINHRATIYLEEYALAGGLRVGDALIAATAAEYNLPLTSGNSKHFHLIKDLSFTPFRP